MPHRYRDEVLSLLRSIDCHYGAALRDQEAGLSIEKAARRQDNVRPDRIVDLSRALQMAAAGENSVSMGRQVAKTACLARCCTSEDRCPPSPRIVV